MKKPRYKAAKSPLKLTEPGSGRARGQRSEGVQTQHLCDGKEYCIQYP